MTRIAILTTLLLALSSAPLPGRAEPLAARYVPGTEDVPLMPGLAADAESGLVFDKPQGRIVAALALGAVRRRDVIAFYRDSLPQLGWRPEGERKFAREGERLRLDFDGSDGHLQVEFTLAPH